jgi:hypothetical protein
MSDIPRLDSIIKTANIPDDPSEIFTELTQEDIYRALIEYYNKFTDLSLLKYDFVDKFSGERFHQLDTTLYKSVDEEINDYEDTGVHYTNYSEDALNTIGLDTGNLWNGDSCIVNYNNDNKTIQFGYTDYYTSTIFSRSLFIETAYALKQSQEDIKNISEESFPLRNKMLSSKNKIHNTPAFCTGASSGGVIIGKYNDDWVLLLGKRSHKPRINKGLISVIPNGGVEYSDYNGSDTFIDTVHRELTEEIPSINQKENISTDQIKVEHAINGWNVRNGGLSAGYSIYFDSELIHEVLEKRTSNFEFSDLIKIPIQSKDAIKNNLEFGNMSPSVVPMIAQTLIAFDERTDTPNLPYDIIEVSDRS